MNWLRSLQGSIAIVAAALLAGWAWVASIKTKAVTEERAAVRRTGEKISKKAEAASKAARSRADSAIMKYYRD